MPWCSVSVFNFEHVFENVIQDPINLYFFLITQKTLMFIINYPMDDTCSRLAM